MDLFNKLQNTVDSVQSSLETKIEKTAKFVEEQKKQQQQQQQQASTEEVNKKDFGALFSQPSLTKKQGSTDVKDFGALFSAPSLIDSLQTSFEDRVKEHAEPTMDTALFASMEAAAAASSKMSTAAALDDDPVVARDEEVENDFEGVSLTQEDAAVVEPTKKKSSFLGASLLDSVQSKIDAASSSMMMARSTPASSSSSVLVELRASMDETTALAEAQLSDVEARMGKYVEKQKKNRPPPPPPPPVVVAHVKNDGLAYMERSREAAEDALEGWADQVVATLAASRGGGIDVEATLRAERDAASCRAEDAAEETAALSQAAAERVGLARRAATEAEQANVGLLRQHDRLTDAAAAQRACHAALAAELEKARSAAGRLAIVEADLSDLKGRHSTELEELRVAQKTANLSALRRLTEQLEVTKQECAVATAEAEKWAGHDDRAAALDAMLTDEREVNAAHVAHIDDMQTKLVESCSRLGRAVSESEARAVKATGEAAAAVERATQLDQEKNKLAKQLQAALSDNAPQTRVAAYPPPPASLDTLEAARGPTTNTKRKTPSACRLGYLNVILMVYAAALSVVTFLSYQSCVQADSTNDPLFGLPAALLRSSATST